MTEAVSICCCWLADSNSALPVEPVETTEAVAGVVLAAEPGFIAILFGGKGSFRLTSQGCRRAIAGVILVTGSQSKHLLTKSINWISSQPPSASVQLLEPGGPRLFLPFESPPKSIILPFGSVLTSE